MLIAKDLSKSYKTKIVGKKLSLSGRINELFQPSNFKFAIKNVNVQINRGEFIGIIGPNGSGKSTFVKLATGILKSTTGTITLFDKDPHRNRRELSKSYSVMFGQKTFFWKNIPIIDSFNVLKSIYNIPKDKFEEKINYLSQALDLKDLLYRVPQKLSLGERIKCEFASIFLHEPEIIFLDEPTIGLDVLVRSQIRSFLREIQKKYSTTIILMSHDLNDIELVTDRILILLNGEIYYDGTPVSFKQKLLPIKFVNFIIEKNISIDMVKSELSYADIVQIIKCSYNIKDDTTNLTISFKTSAISAMDIIKNFPSKYELKDINVSDPSLDNVIEYLFKKNIKN